MIFQLKSREEEVLRKRVGELESQIMKLEHNLIHDKLTGLKARAYFEEEVGTYLQVMSNQSQATVQRREDFGFKNLSILFFDIDHFKKVNDTYGHEMGDLVLCRVAQTIHASLRTGDTVARWGGEEIVANLLGATREDAMAKAEEVRRKVEALKFREEPELKVTVSIGVSPSQAGVGLAELVRRADEALYKAKESGRNRVVAYGEN